METLEGAVLPAGLLVSLLCLLSSPVGPQAGPRHCPFPRSLPLISGIICLQRAEPLTQSWRPCRGPSGSRGGALTADQMLTLSIRDAEPGTLEWRRAWDAVITGAGGKGERLGSLPPSVERV